MKTVDFSFHFKRALATYLVINEVEKTEGVLLVESYKVLKPRMAFVYPV